MRLSTSFDLGDSGRAVRGAGILSSRANPVKTEDGDSLDSLKLRRLALDSDLKGSVRRRG